MDISKSTELDKGYLEGLFGPEGATREAAAECAQALRDGERSFVDKQDADFFTPEAFRRLILNKVIRSD